MNEHHIGSIFPFVYAVKPDSERRPRAGVQRDGGALLHLSWILGEEGYRLDSAWHNFPEYPYLKQQPTIAELADFDFSRVRPGDYFVQPTRPPLDDPKDGPRKRVPRGDTSLEMRFEKFWCQFLDHCDRGTVRLTPDVQRGLLPGFEAYRNMGFQVNSGSDVTMIATGRPPVSGSVAFCLRTDAMWPGGPGLFAAWGMEADATYAWSWILHHRMRHLAQRRGLFMVALESPRERCFRGDYAAIANTWNATLVLEHEFTDEI